MSRRRAYRAEGSSEAIHALVAVGMLGLCIGLIAMQGAAEDAVDPPNARPPHPLHGTRFLFEVIESFNAKYAGDTPGHIGRGGGITLHPDVALGDAVHHRIDGEDKTIGVVTGARWDRLRGSLAIEFRPREDHRIAVGDEVWVDLAPAPRADAPDAPDAPARPRVRITPRPGDTDP